MIPPPFLNIVEKHSARVLSPPAIYDFHLLDPLVDFLAFCSGSRLLSMECISNPTRFEASYKPYQLTKVGRLSLPSPIFGLLVLYKSVTVSILIECHMYAPITNFLPPLHPSESVITRTEQILPRKMTDSGVHVHEEHNVHNICEYMHYRVYLTENNVTTTMIRAYRRQCMSPW